MVGAMLGLIETCLEICRTLAAERRMEASSIGEHLDVLEQRLPRFGVTLVMLVVDVSRLSVLKKLSTTVLSSQFPVQLMLASTWWADKSDRFSSLAY